MLSSNGPTLHHLPAPPDPPPDPSPIPLLPRSNMVHLKYGEDQAMNPRLIEEAGTALGRWMAAHRETKAGNSMDVSSFSREYLAATSSGSGSSGGANGGGGRPTLAPESSGSSLPSLSSRQQGGMDSGGFGGSGGYMPRGNSSSSLSLPAIGKLSEG
jgi:hypothetical protein